ncbi:MAG: glycosyltransferase family 4 protein [Chloroflexi bacterium]|nr:glycosyltransferase family 4 protein [Chloroflexota bacterium]
MTSRTRMGVCPRKRITLVLTQSLDCPSGVGRYWPLARGLVRCGYHVTVVALHPAFYELAQRATVREGVTVCYVGQMHVRKQGARKTYFSPAGLLWVAAVATLRLTWAALNTPSDLYHLGKAQPMNGIVACVLRLVGRRVLLDCDDAEAASNRFGAKWQEQIVGWFEDRMPRWVSGVTVNTRFLQQRVEAVVRGSRPVWLIPNAADANRLQVPETEVVSELRDRLGLADRYVVAYIGSLELANHPLDLLLESFAIAVQRAPRSVLLLVGGGSDLDLLQRRVMEMGIQESVCFVGRVDPNEVAVYYALADVTVDPVLDDDTARARSPLKLYESLMIGTPVVTGDVGDRRYVVGDEDVMLVPAGDAQAFAERLVRLSEDDATYRRLREWAGKHHAQFRWESRLDQFVDVYEHT